MDHAGAFSVIVGRSVRAARTVRGLGQEQVAARMRALGFTAWLRQTVGQVERGKRRLVVDEVLALSFALQTTIAELIMPAADEETVDLPNGQAVSVALIRHSIRGTRATDVRWAGDQLVLPTAGAPFRSTPASAERDESQDEFRAAVLQRIEDLERRLHEERARNGHDPIPVEEALEQPIATAIVTSNLGVLVGRRNDGKPPWTFIAGEVEPGESPADAAEREVKEETGLEVEAGQVIGERVHPKTGRTMIYMAARPVRGTEVIVGDEDELAEVRWVSLAEADELMAAYGMFEPVHEHLARELGE
jgi:8-oxo-dGTP diphosphatase